MQADLVADALRSASYGKTNRYEDLMDMANAKLVVNTTQKMDLLSRQIYMQSKSFDEVVELCKKQDDMLACIPAISGGQQGFEADGFGIWKSYRPYL